MQLPQRKLVDLGKIISRIVSANHVANLGADGFRMDLINDSLLTIKQEISMFISAYTFNTSVVPIEDYKQDSAWLSYC